MKITQAPTHPEVLAGRPFRAPRKKVTTVAGLARLIQEARDAGAVTTHECTLKEAAQMSDKLIIVSR